VKADLNEEGLRVVAVASRELPPAREVYGLADERELVLIGYVAFLDPPKESTAPALSAMYIGADLDGGASKAHAFPFDLQCRHEKRDDVTFVSGPLRYFYKANAGACYKSHEPMSASTPVPPGWPSAPYENTSTSPLTPGDRYW
jgi:hypothetical protein